MVAGTSPQYQCKEPRLLSTVIKVVSTMPLARLHALITNIFHNTMHAKSIYQSKQFFIAMENLPGLGLGPVVLI